VFDLQIVETFINIVQNEKKIKTHAVASSKCKPNSI